MAVGSVLKPSVPWRLPAIIFVLFLLAGLPPEALGCTLWAAAGSRVEGGGVLAAKNRDVDPDHRQELRLVRPPGGFRYLGLVALNRKEPGVKVGINEKGLVIADAAASCLPASRHGLRPEVPHLNEELLAACADVNAVLRRKLMFLAPAFYLVADPSRAALLEVSPEGEVAVRCLTQGSLAHTNQYLEGEFQAGNEKVSRSSRVRLARIWTLLAQRPQGLTLQDFIDFSNDRHDGPDRSIWRSGASPRKIRTLASWIVHLPPGEAPRLYLKLANPGEPPVIYRLQLNDSFWARALTPDLKPTRAGGEEIWPHPGPRKNEDLDK
jgi:hypothetical protein